MDQRWKGGNVIKIGIKHIVDALTKLKSSPSLVAIDGRGGAGKSTLAQKLAEELEKATVIHMDDFYRVMNETKRELLSPRQGYKLYFDWQRLKTQVLQPLSLGKPACYQRYDWSSGQLAEWHEIAPKGLIIVEGVTSARPELRSYYDTIIFVDTPDELLKQRLLARRETSEDWIERWAAAERHYQVIHAPDHLADFVISGVDDSEL